MGEFGHMKDLQTLLSALGKDPKTGLPLPDAQLVAYFRAACPLDQAGLSTLIGCIAECSEAIYEHYRVLIDLFRQEIRHIQPDEETILKGIALGILDDEEWEG